LGLLLRRGARKVKHGNGPRDLRWFTARLGGLLHRQAAGR